MMNLHTDRDSFLALLNIQHERTGVRADILEKDYYVSLLLHELAGKQNILPAYFKGGTALYKAMGTIRRFSEDIDLTVSIEKCTNSQAKKRLERAAHNYTSLPRMLGSDLEENRRGSITSVYGYEPVVELVADEDPLNRFRIVKIEATSFTVSEPYEDVEIAPELYLNAFEEERATLRSQFDVHPFHIKTITLERIFADKIFAAEFYYQRGEYFDIAKHMYDITVLMETERIQQLLEAPEHFITMLAYKRLEEHVRIGSNLANSRYHDFSYLKNIFGDNALKSAFDRMQRIYVFNDSDLIAYSKAEDSIRKLKDILYQLDE